MRRKKLVGHPGAISERSFNPPPPHAAEETWSHGWARGASEVSIRLRRMRRKKRRFFPGIERIPQSFNPPPPHAAEETRGSRAADHRSGVSIRLRRMRRKKPPAAAPQVQVDLVSIRLRRMRRKKPTGSPSGISTACFNPPPPHAAEETIPWRVAFALQDVSIRLRRMRRKKRIFEAVQVLPIEFQSASAACGGRNLIGWLHAHRHRVSIRLRRMRRKKRGTSLRSQAKTKSFNPPPPHAAEETTGASRPVDSVMFQSASAACGGRNTCKPDYGAKPVVSIRLRRMRRKKLRWNGGGNQAYPVSIRLRRMRRKKRLPENPNHLNRIDTAFRELWLGCPIHPRERATQLFGSDGRQTPLPAAAKGPGVGGLLGVRDGALIRSKVPLSPRAPSHRNAQFYVFGPLQGNRSADCPPQRQSPGEADGAASPSRIRVRHIQRPTFERELRSPRKLGRRAAAAAGPPRSWY